jgi:hypothetical protein
MKGSKGDQSMARRQKWVEAGVYQPRQRQPYGRRVSTGLEVEELKQAGNLASATTVAEHLSTRVAVPMPHGGVRWLLQCPQCHRHITRLYQAHATALYACRQCLGLRYWSQYEGRRPEAEESRLERLAAQAAESSQTAAEQRRRRRIADARRVLEQRRDRYLERRKVAFTLALLLLLAREDGSWMRQQITVDDAGKFVEGTGLELSQNPARPRVNEPAVLAGQHDPLGIAEWRARYRALGYPRAQAA